MTAIAIIPARGGSKRIPGKNLRPFRGRPIIDYSIIAAKACMLFETVAVSTDDQAIAEHAHKFDLTVLWRSKDLSGDLPGTDSVMHRHLKDLPVFNHACCIYATAPFISTQALRDGYRMLQERDWAQFVFTMGIDPNQDAAQWYWGRRTAWINKLHFVREHSVIYQVKHHCDINTPEDWQRAEELYAQIHRND